jgi:DNA repair exonuclease SbcCD ATPase subunit
MSDVDELVTMLNQANENMNWLTNESGKLFESIKTKRDEVQTVTDQIGQIRLQIQQEQSNAMLDITNRKNEKNIQKNTVYNNILNLQNEVKKLENIKDVCPTCGQKLVGVQKPDTTEQKNQIEILQGDLRTLTEEYTQLCKEYDDLQSFYNDKLNQHINPLTLQKTTLSNELTKLNNDYNGIQDNIKRQQPLIQKLQNDITNHNATVENLNKLIIDSENSINKLNEELVYFSEEMDIVKTRLDIINKFITITNRDFRGYLLKNVIDFIDKKSKEYCMDIFQTDKLDFKLDGNNIDITYCGKPYEACSGGEKQKLDIIIQFAIRDMLCQFLDYRCNIIALDEIFDQMDSIGCDRIVDLITKKLTDVDSIFIITHHTDISIPSDSIITVVKQDNGISTINE